MKILFLLSSSFAYVSMARAYTTQWEDYTATVSPLSMYKPGILLGTTNFANSPNAGSSTYIPTSSSSQPIPSSSSSSTNFANSPNAGSSTYISTSSSSLPISSSSSSPTNFANSPNAGSSTYIPTSSSSLPISFSSSSTTNFANSPNAGSSTYIPTSSSSLLIPSSSSSTTNFANSPNAGSSTYIPTSSSSLPIPSSSSSTTNFANSPNAGSSTYIPTTSSSSQSIPSSSPTTGNSGSQTMDPSLASTLLELQNEKRARHQDTPPLVWNSDLSAWAYNYADSLKGTLFEPCSGNLKHSSDRHNQGENIAYATYTNWADLIDLWYDEIKYYNYNDVTGIFHDGQEVGHFTQLVWASSREVGCAAIRCPHDASYLLCEYSPAGNIYISNAGQDEFALFKENVKPLK